MVGPRGRVVEDGEATTRWIRYTYRSSEGIGTVSDEIITMYRGDLFGQPEPTGETVPLSEVELRYPCQPTKMVGLWNNFGAAADKNGWSRPTSPLWFLKPTSSFLDPNASIRSPHSYDGRVLFEGELGVVIGSEAVNVALKDAHNHIFGYTCVNDVTALGLLTEDPSFAQWSRAKSLDTFGPFGPAIATGIDLADKLIRTTVNGRERQNYPISDMIFSPLELVHRISQDMTLFPGDIIACGTSTGAMPLRPGAEVTISIDGIGELTNTYQA